MTAKDLVSKALGIAQNCKTLYVMGCFGAPMTAANKARYIKNGAAGGYNARADRMAMINATTADTFGFDCVNLIKGILWGWNGDPARTYGGAVYNSNGVPDLDANQMIRVCSKVSTDFRGIVPGAAVWMQDHIGIYIEEGLCVECSPKWANGVQVTAVGNIGKKSGYNTRTWTKWGLLPYINYEEAEDLTEEQTRKVVREEFEKLLAERDAAQPTEQWQRDVLASAVAMGISDGSRPMGLCTRLEAMGIAARAARKQ